MDEEGKEESKTLVRQGKDSKADNSGSRVELDASVGPDLKSVFEDLPWTEENPPLG